MEEKQTFEQRLNQVQEIMEGIESGKLSLEDSVGKFETGIRILNALEQELGDIRRRITVLTEAKDGGTEEIPMEEKP